MNYLYCNISAHRLGNALFMAASTIGIARLHMLKPLFPANWKYRQYFNIPDEMFGDCEVNYTYNEPHFHYAEVEIRDSGNIELRGYFQSEKYFSHCKDEILEYLTPKGIEPGSIEAVAIHHRRGDYINNPNYQQLGMGYYISAYDHIFKGKEIRAFSDDINYIDLHYGGNTLNAKAVSDIEDLKNIIACKNHICGNSTFSWWGAYLSKGFAVRPSKYFAGPLSQTHDEKDLWPVNWAPLDITSRVGIGDVTFIIPFMADHADRVNNILTVYNFITKHFDTNILIGEINTEKLTESIKYKMGVFHRTKVLNDLTRRANTPYVFNWDADVACSPFQVYNAVAALRNGNDVVYPFDGTVANIPRHSIGGFVASLDVGVFAGKVWPWMGATYKSVGMAFCYNKESFLRVGGENEGFVSYGAEDQERYMRFKRLGLRVERVSGTVFHLDHHRGKDSNESHSNAMGNRSLFEDELKLYRAWCTEGNDSDVWRPFQSSIGKICEW